MSVRFLRSCVATRFVSLSLGFSGLGHRWLVYPPAFYRGVSRGFWLVCLYLRLSRRLHGVHPVGLASVFYVVLYRFPLDASLGRAFETFYGVLKSRLGLEYFTGLGAEAVLQDLYASVFLSGLESILSRPAQSVLVARETKLPQQVNRSVSFHAIKDRLRVKSVSLFRWLHLNSSSLMISLVVSRADWALPYMDVDQKVAIIQGVIFYASLT